jgi:hypothetical protein
MGDQQLENKQAQAEADEAKAAKKASSKKNTKAKESEK